MEFHPVASIFPMLAQDELDDLAEDIRQHGLLEPIWTYQGMIIDGRNRYTACLIAEVQPRYQTWDGKGSLIEFVVSLNLKRRQLTSSQRAMAAINIEEQLAVEAKTRQLAALKQNADEAPMPRQRESTVVALMPQREERAKSRDTAAEMLGTSPRYVQDAKKIQREAPELAERVRSGTISIPAATAQIRRTPKATSYSIQTWGELTPLDRAGLITQGREVVGTLNKQETGSIEWARWSWNPITGCLHNCPYCYARDIANRFYPQKFIPTFHPERLGAPMHQRVPDMASTELGWKNIFTCSMADLFGKWVPAEWIEAVLDVIRDCPQWNFLLLTKFPNRLAEFTFPANAWLGTSVDCQARVKNAEQSFAKVRGGVKWLSIEPMLEPLQFTSLSMFDWVVIGGASASNETPAWTPPLRWVRDLETAAREAGCMVYEKTNLDPRVREYPGWDRPEAELPSALRYLPSIG